MEELKALSILRELEIEYHYNIEDNSEVSESIVEIIELCKAKENLELKVQMLEKQIAVYKTFITTKEINVCRINKDSIELDRYEGDLNV